MTKQELNEIEARAKAATEGPWRRVQHYDSSGVYSTTSANPIVPATARSPIPNLEFIAHARTDIPALIAEVRRLQELLEEPKVSLVDGHYYVK